MSLSIQKSRGRLPVFVATVLVLAFIAVCEASGLDLPAARLFGDVHGFPWRDHWLLTGVMHEGGRGLSWLGAIALCLGVWWPFGPLRRLDLGGRLQLAVSALAGALVVSAIKSGSATSCPWDMQAFGGVAHLVPHWRFDGGADGGSGHCFPAGHASSGFAFVGGWFVFRDWPAIARTWLLVASGTGLLLGLGQQVRGAHFMSHTLWSGWICWVVAWAVDTVWPEVVA